MFPFQTYNSLPLYCKLKTKIIITLDELKALRELQDLRDRPDGSSGKDFFILPLISFRFLFFFNHASILNFAIFLLHKIYFHLISQIIFLFSRFILFYVPFVRSFVRDCILSNSYLHSSIFPVIFLFSSSLYLE